MAETLTLPALAKAKVVVPPQLWRQDDPYDWEALRRFTDSLPDTDEEPMESPWHLFAIQLMLQPLAYHWRDRRDFYMGGNMFLYYSLQDVTNPAFKGPDFFYVNGVERDKPRDKWTVWMEGGRYPDFIMEFLSPSTAKTDRTTKKTLYEQIFRTQEYFLFDPQTNRMEGWRRNPAGVYEALTPDHRGWLWSGVLGLWIGPWTGEFNGLQGTWPRCYDSLGQLVPLPAEAEQQRAEAERQRAEAERQRAEAERQRADTAEAEVARLQALLAQTQQRRQ
jgi:Uma2 family endonuclease